MTKVQKNEVIEVLKEKFSQYNNFYVTDTEALSVAQVVKLRRACFNKEVEMKVAKNTLIKKALESLDSEKYSGLYESLHKVTALLFSENPKNPAMIISAFRKESKTERPVLKAAFINGDVYMGDDKLKSLTEIKTKNELIGEVIGLLQSPAKRVLAALLNYHEQQAKGEFKGANAEAITENAPKAEATAPAATEAAPPEATAPPATEEAPKAEAAPVAEAPKVEAAEAPKAEDTETPKAEGETATGSDEAKAE